MSVANLWNIPKDPNSLSLFSFSNQDSHRRIIDAILAQRSIFLQLSIVDPIPLYSIGVWARVHQTMHDEMSAVLGTQGNDFSDVDLNDPAQLESWVQLHASSHVQAENILGIG